ncbi:hypothetical protein GUITHDRAFT_47020, partial [Guillardia theta CCMP2712]
PERPYQAREDIQKISVVHWGQRKLFVAEMSFLSAHYTPSITTVVYAGAAPGTHLVELMLKFQKLSWVLVDPEPFHHKLRDFYSSSVTLIQDRFTDAFAAQFAGRNDVLFISDIRTADHNRDNKEENERKIAQDMQNQKRWFRIMNPVAALLKFRLPWDNRMTTYPMGKIQYPVWGRVSTTETQLIVLQNAPDTVYDNKRYESKMFYHNTIAR